VKFQAGLPWLILSALALAAYFGGRGISALLDAALLPAPGAGLLAVPSPRREAAPAARPVTAQPILERNPFDSRTGPLFPERPESPAAPPPPVDPLMAPACAEVDVYSTAESNDPYWSTAIVQAPGEPAGQLRRVGDEVGDKTVAYIGYNPLKRSPAVWLSGSAAVCQSLLFDGTPRRGVKRPPAPRPPPKPAPPPRKRRGRFTPVSKELAAKIQRVNATEFRVERSAIDEVLARSSELMRGTKMLPIQREGALVGMRLQNVRKNSLLGVLGLQNGDQIEAINGFPLAGPEQALKAYANLRTASSLRVRLTRGGRARMMEYRIH